MNFVISAKKEVDVPTGYAALYRNYLARTFKDLKFLVDDTNQVEQEIRSAAEKNKVISKSSAPNVKQEQKPVRRMEMEVGKVYSPPPMPKKPCPQLQPTNFGYRVPIYFITLRPFTYNAFGQYGYPNGDRTPYVYRYPQFRFPNF